jgi:LacI family transcriptional regulator
MENITLKKISEVLGVSISTVSRALKNHPDISANTINKVKELANTLDYEPNANAISLRTQNSKVFGLMIPSTNNSFYGSFLSSLENESRENGYSLMIMQSHDNPDVEKEILKFFRKNRVTGVFACLSPGTKDFEMYQKLSEAEIPVVFFDKVYEDHPYNVCVSDYQAAKIGADTLINKGKKNILAIFGNKKVSITKARLNAFKETIKQYPEVQTEIVFAENYNQSLEITKEFYSKNNKPDAVFCMSDEILTGSIKALQHLGINYPKETGIISISDGYFPKLFQPEITYVETSGEKLGKLAADSMMCIINKEPLSKNQMIEVVLVEGGSI